MNEWYTTLVRPPLTPPGWVFGPVWSVLYCMIVLSLYLFFRHRAEQTFWLTAIVVIHAISNLLWTSLFFSLRSPGLALIDIALLVLTLIVMIWQFWSIHRTAALLLLPYLAWVLFATYLNAGFYLLNRS